MAQYDDYFLHDPRKQLFYRFYGYLMTYTATGDMTHWGYDPPNKLIKMNRFLVLKFSPVVFVSQIAYLFIHHKHLSFDTLSIMFSVIPVTFLVNACILCARLDANKKVMKYFMTRIHLYNYQDLGDFVKIRRRFIERLSRWTFYYLFVFLMLDWVAWITVIGLKNIENWELIENGTMPLRTVIYFVMPFDYEYNFKIWIIYHLLNVYIIWHGCIIIVVFNALNFFFVYHLIGHIEILKHKLKTEFDGDFNDGEIKNKLIGVIKYHAFVVNVFRDMEAGFGLNVSAYYFYNLIADSLILYQIMVGDKGNLVVFGLMAVVYLGCLILMSFVLEEIRRQSDGLSELVYNLPFESMSMSNQKMVIMILARVQPPMVFKGSGGLRAGVAPMISIIKSTFSYYVMLKSSM